MNSAIPSALAKWKGSQASLRKHNAGLREKRKSTCKSNVKHTLFAHSEEKAQKKALTELTISA